METLALKATSHTPLIEFCPEGKLKMEGRLFPEDVNKFFEPLITYVSDLETESVILDVNLEYFNTASSKKIMDLFKHLDANNNVTSILINWHYEEGDDDSLETAEIFEESLLRTKFRYMETEDQGL